MAGAALGRVMARSDARPGTGGNDALSDWHARAAAALGTTRDALALADL